MIYTLVQGGYDAGYLYKCAIGKVAATDDDSTSIVATEPLQAVLIEDCDDVPVSSMAVRSVCCY